ncbi:hypothetical protein BRCON_2257 [Candidatus Sumerlaea chitinivorans]|uniref:Uncharacterized protein n=1 Tax=Sumerlaea chitinivorans TaxID=2250252 RepID=A0A2Z4Y735_SUMC1|nr:hypothetical protein BRCON_2257 [Candidatus Sumerlaea chitinivorans]
MSRGRERYAHPAVGRQETANPSGDASGSSHPHGAEEEGLASQE